MSQEEQLISFFAYSFFVYPVTNWLVSQPKKVVVTVKKKAPGGGDRNPNQEDRVAAQNEIEVDENNDMIPVVDVEKTKAEERWRKWKGVILAIIFLITVSALHMAYENMENGPNAYSMLNMSRGSSSSLIRKTYRNLSRELHPDKNKSPTAAEDFQRVKHAYDVIIEPDLRRVYNLLGDAGVKASVQTVIDHKYIMTQMIVYYASTLIFAFLMTFSDPTGDAFSLALFGLIFMLFAETCLVIEEFELPSWFLPYTTSHDIVTTLHRIFPAFMNGGRSIIGVFSENEKDDTMQALASMQQSASYVGSKLCAMLIQITSTTTGGGLLDGGNGDDSGGIGMSIEGTGTSAAATRREIEERNIQEHGLMAAKIKAVRRQISGCAWDCEGGREIARVTTKGTVLADPALLRASQRQEGEAGPGNGGAGAEHGEGTAGAGGAGGLVESLSAMFGEYMWVRNLLAYCLMRYLVRGYMPKNSA